MCVKSCREAMPSCGSTVEPPVSSAVCWSDGVVVPLVVLPEIIHRLNSEGDIFQGEISDGSESDPEMPRLCDSSTDEETLRT